MKVICIFTIYNDGWHKKSMNDLDSMLYLPRWSSVNYEHSLTLLFLVTKCMLSLIFVVILNGMFFVNVLIINVV